MKHFPRRAGPPLAEPLTLADALTHLREVSDGGENDAYIMTLIGVARQACEDRIERSLIATPWVLRLPEFCNVIELAQAPVISVQAVRYFDADGIEQTLDLASVHVDTASQPALLSPVDEWPETQPRPNAVTVEYTAGFGTAAADVPLPLRQWILLAIGTMYDVRHADAVQPVVPHAFADYLLNPYRVLGF